jgi:type VI secretion system protein ImpJ
MKYLSRVVWSEGMYLGPHHFQAQSRYFEDSIRFATSTLWYEAWGLVGVELDTEALSNGTVSLVHARGLFPDGLAFNMPECDPLPAPRNIAEAFPVTRDTVTILLTVPPRKPNGVNCSGSMEEANGARFIAESRMLFDETTGRDEKPVPLGRKNLKLALDIEPNDNLLTIPVARIMREGSGRFAFDPSFVPPCMQISSSARLMFLVKRLLEILDEKSTTLSRPKQSSTRGWADYSTRDIASFWMLHAVNAALAPLRHIFLAKRGHPEELYTEMARLAGALCTFAIDSHPRAIPLYDHRNLDKCFDALDHHIRTHLETMVPTNCIAIPLTRKGDYFWEGSVTDQRCVHRSRWVLSIKSRIGEVQTIARTPQLAKLCSTAYVGKLVERALPGLGLTHLPVPPPAISRHVDVQYFSVSQSGPCWDHIVQTRQIGLYVPGDIPDPELELLVVLDT